MAEKSLFGRLRARCALGRQTWSAKRALGWDQCRPNPYKTRCFSRMLGQLSQTALLVRSVPHQRSGKWFQRPAWLPLTGQRAAAAGYAKRACARRPSRAPASARLHREIDGGVFVGLGMVGLPVRRTEAKLPLRFQAHMAAPIHGAAQARREMGRRALRSRGAGPWPARAAAPPAKQPRIRRRDLRSGAALATGIALRERCTHRANTTADRHTQTDDG